MAHEKFGNILIVDDDLVLLKTLKLVLNPQFKKVTTLSNPNQLISNLGSNDYDAILLDMNFKAKVNTGNEGIYWLKKILEFNADANVIFITAYGNVSLAITAVKEGALDFVLKPWENAKLITTLKNAVLLKKSKETANKYKNRQQQLNRDLESSYKNIIGQSSAFKNLMAKIEKAAKSDANILITGESGSGKELIAWEIHRQSERAEEVFVKVDLGSINENLIENELFGHEKGAFTDSHETRQGRFEIANKGSLFLDEITNLNIQLQPKLLSALENRCIYRLGSNEPTMVDVRVIAATNDDINKMIVQNRFREDLYFRLNTIIIKIPPLRERRDDIPLLIDHFVEKYWRKHNQTNIKILAKTKEKLKSYSWPGNVRELEHSIERAIIMCDGKALRPENFNLEDIVNIEIADDFTKPLTLDELEEKALRASLERNKWKITETANELGISRPAIYRKLKKYDL